MAGDADALKTQRLWPDGQPCDAVRLHAGETLVVEVEVEEEEQMVVLMLCPRSQTRELPRRHWTSPTERQGRE
jgi:hypothetical protein